jgi:hypothetical protein
LSVIVGGKEFSRVAIKHDISDRDARKITTQAIRCQDAFGIDDRDALAKRIRGFAKHTHYFANILTNFARVYTKFYLSIHITTLHPPILYIR